MYFYPNNIIIITSSHFSFEGINQNTNIFSGHISNRLFQRKLYIEKSSSSSCGRVETTIGTERYHYREFQLFQCSA